MSSLKSLNDEDLKKARDAARDLSFILCRNPALTSEATRQWIAHTATTADIYVDMRKEEAEKGPVKITNPVGKRTRAEMIAAGPTEFARSEIARFLNDYPSLEACGGDQQRQAQWYVLQGYKPGVDMPRLYGN